MSHHNKQAWAIDEATGLPYELEPEERPAAILRQHLIVTAHRLRAEGRTVDQIAQRLGLSERTIHRWLREEGTTSA